MGCWKYDRRACKVNETSMNIKIYAVCRKVPWWKEVGTKMERRWKIGKWDLKYKLFWQC